MSILDIYIYRSDFSTSYLKIWLLDHSFCLEAFLDALFLPFNMHEWVNLRTWRQLQLENRRATSLRQHRLFVWVIGTESRKSDSILSVSDHEQVVDLTKDDSVCQHGLGAWEINLGFKHKPVIMSCSLCVRIQACMHAFGCVLGIRLWSHVFLSVTLLRNTVNIFNHLNNKR